MRIFDGIRLAAAKLKAHRIRTGIVSLIVSLLFAGIVLVLCITAGIAQSLESFGKEGLGNRFIIRATPIVDMSFLYDGKNEQLLAELKPLNEQMKSDKKADAKRLGLQYNPAVDPSLPLQDIDFGGGKKTLAINPDSQVSKDVIKKMYGDMPNIGFEDFEKLANSSGAKAVYKSTGTNSLMQGMHIPGNRTSVSAIIDGEEQTRDPNKNFMGIPGGFDKLTMEGWQYFDSELMKPFVLEGQHLALGKNDSIPVIAPVSAATDIVGMKKPANTASGDEQLEFLRKLRTNISGKEAELCYRNPASTELLSLAREQVKEIQRNKGKKDYIMPALQYALPSVPCGATTVKKDTRSTEEKKAAANELAFKQKYENYESPIEGIIRVRVVGVVPEMNFANGFSVRDMIAGFVSSSLGSGWYVPNDVIPTDSLANRIAEPFERRTPNDQSYYAEFASYDQAKSFIKNNSCTLKLSYETTMGIEPGAQDSRVTKCHATGKYFDFEPFGNNASALEDLRSNVWKGVRYVAPVVLILASLVLMGVIGKLIADSRRETAVFRALGATRGSIEQIYFTYSVFLALFIAFIALVIGASGAFLISQRYSPDASLVAVLAYNAKDINKEFILFGLDPLYIGLIVGLVVLAALIATMIPVFSNVSRNPMRDMRDE